MKVQFNGEEYDGQMSMESFVKSLEIRNYMIPLAPKCFNKVKPDQRLMEVCEELGIAHIG